MGVIKKGSIIMVCHQYESGRVINRVGYGCIINMKVGVSLIELDMGVSSIRKDGMTWKGGCVPTIIKIIVPIKRSGHICAHPHVTFDPAGYPQSLQPLIPMCHRHAH